MATISFSRSSATTVWCSASGLTTTHTYSIQVYGTRWVDKVTGLVGSTSYTKSFSVNGPASYQARLWDNTISGVAATGTIPAWSSISVYAQCAAGVSQFTLYYGGATKVVSASSGSVSVDVDSGTTVRVENVVLRTGYKRPYLLWYNTQSDLYGYHGPKEFTSTTTIDATFERRIKVGATDDAVYPYRQMVYIDDVLKSDTTNSTYTEDRIVISDLSNYGYYFNQGYEFQYAYIGASTIPRDANYSVPLTANLTTKIQLYFKTPIKSVKPLISSIATTGSSATIHWSKDGGNSGEWRLYYGTSASALQLHSIISSSPTTVSNLKGSTTYYFMIKNWVSASDYKDSNTYSARTKASISSFAWTSSDATMITAGKPVTNLTAAAWRNLAACVNQVRTASGSSEITIPSVSSGSQITASLFNSLRGYIAGLNGAGTVVGEVVAGGIVYASYFANSTSALKEAINRAIANANL